MLPTGFPAMYSLRFIDRSRPGRLENLLARSTGQEFFRKIPGYGPF